MSKKKLSQEKLNSIKQVMLDAMRYNRVFVPYGVDGKTKLPTKISDIPVSMITWKNKIYMSAYKVIWKENSNAASASNDYVIGTSKEIVSKPHNSETITRPTRLAVNPEAQPVIIRYNNGTVVNINPNGPIEVHFKTT